MRVAPPFLHMNFDRLPRIPAHTWRALRPDDSPALVRLELACSTWDGATNLTTEAEWAVKLAKAAWIGQFGVRPGWQGQGVAAATLAECLRRCAAAGLRYAMLNVNIDNPRARHLYERLGFKLSKSFTMYHKVLTDLE